MGLFDKKYCDVCGEKIGLLGNRKLEDGNLCKDCAAKLSPWFSDRRRSTVEDIKAQLAYREENRAKVEAFHTTRTLGREMLICLDEDNGKFLVAKGKNLSDENPDVLDFTQVTGCDLDIQENHSEITQAGPDGKQVSTNPPSWRYSYDFYMILRVNHPWFDEMRFKLNNRTVEIRTGGGFGMRPMGRPGGARPLGGMGFGFGASSGAPDLANNAEYQMYVQMGEEIKAAVMQVRQDARDNIAAANAPKTSVTCPHCGATTIPDASGRCEFCGGSVV